MNEMTTRPEHFEDVVAVYRLVAGVFFVNLRLRVAKKLPANVIVAEGGERVFTRTSASAGREIKESTKEENEVDKGYSSWVRSLRGLSSILDIGPDNGPSS